MRTLQSCWPCDNSSNGCREKHLLHANNAGAAVAIFIDEFNLWILKKILC